MALEAGSVYAILGGRFVPTGFAQFDAAMKRSAAGAAAAERAISASQARTSRSAVALGAASKVGAAGVAAIGLAAAASVKKSMAFNAQLSELKAVTKASAADMKRMSTAALELGAKTGVGATKAAQAMTELAKGGLNTEKTIGALKGTIALAQAGSLDLGVAAETVANALNLFKLGGEDATMVADSLANAANATTADVTFFAQGLAQGGAAAKAAGLDFQQTTVFLEAMAANGFKSGSDAGTSMKTALIQLANPTAKAQAAAAKLGVTFFDQQGQLKPLPTLAKDLGNAFKGMSDRQKLATAAQIAGTDGMRALLALADQGPNKLREFARANAQTGTAAAVAAEKQNNLAGSLQKLGANIETVAIQVGDQLEPALKDAADALNDFIAAGGGDQIASGFSSLFTVARTSLSALIFGFAGLAGIIGKVAWGLDKITFGKLGLGTVATDLQNVSENAAQLALDLGNVDQAANKPIVVTADAQQAKSELAKLKAVKLGPKVQKVLADGTASVEEKVRRLIKLGVPPKVARFLTSGDTKVRDKIEALIALGIPPKTARLLARDLTASGVASARAQIASLPNLKTINISANIDQRLFNLPSLRRAAGRGPGGSEVAMVGEGGGPEYVVNRRSGKSMRVDGPTVMRLGKDDYVIPTERRYADRANELLMSLARDLGIVGYKKGKKPKPAPPRAQAPKRGAGGGGKPKNPKESADQKRAREERRKILGKQGIAFSRHSLDWYDQEIAKEERYKDNKGKDKKLTARARQARKRLDALRKEKRKAQQYKAKIDKATSEADIALDQMREADTRDDQGGFDKAWRVRKDQLAAAIKLIDAAVGESNPNSTWNRELRAQLAKLRGDQADLGANPPPVADPAESAETTFTAAEQQRLAELEASIATAQLTTTPDDDRSALQAKIDFLSPILAAASAAQGRGRGGFGAITEIANDLRSTRDQLQNLTGPGDSAPAPDTGPTPDQQALIDQARALGLAQGQTSFIDRLAGATLQGSPTLVFQSYVPPSPTEAKRLADYTISGIGFQGQSPSSTERVGV